MSRIKLRDKDIKLRGRESLTAKAVQRVNIQAIAKNTKPSVLEDQTIESDAVDTGENMSVSSVRRVTVIRKQVAKKRSQKKAPKNPRTAKDTPEPSPAVSRTPQKNSPAILAKEQPASTTKSSVPQPIKTVHSHSDPATTYTKTFSHIGTLQNTTPSKILPIGKLEIKSSKAVRPKQLYTSIKPQSNITPIIHQSVQRIQYTKAAVAQATAANKRKIGEKIQHVLKSVPQRIGKAIGRKLPLLFGSAAGVLAPIIIVILAGAILASPMGIFFSGDADNDLSIQQVMGQCNAQLSQQITDIENSVSHDKLEQTGQTALWKDVLAVYAVKVTTDPEHPLEVVTMDEERAELLREIFFAMNTVDYFTEIYTEEITVEVTDEDCNVTEENQTIERTRLMITVSGKTAEQMANEYQFNEEQLQFLTELLSEDYANLWYGLPGGGSDDIVAVALSQVGNLGGQPYWSWYGFSSRVAWCACFVSWCGDQCGYIESGAMPKFSYCPTGVQWFKNHVQWADRSTIPEPGYIVFFDWDYDGISDHVGIVESSDGSTVYTIEGNSSDACRQLSYPVGSRKIMGYGIISC